MPSQTTQIADPSFSPAKSRDTQGLLPLTVKQISEAFQASDDKTNFLIDGVDVNNVKLVGRVFQKTERVTMFLLYLMMELVESIATDDRWCSSRTLAYNLLLC